MYCGAAGDLQWDHVIPLALGGPDTIDNLVRACGPCNRAKSDRDLMDWYGGDGEQVPRLALGKYLKLLLQRHAELGTLDDLEYPAGSPVRLANLHRAFIASV